jgi:hypothetical protein
MNTFCPAEDCARSFSACHEVSPTIGIDAACTKSRLAGFSAASALGHHRELGDRARTQVEDVGEDRIARLETGHAAADLGHHTGQIAAQRGRQLELQDRP